MCTKDILADLESLHSIHENLNQAIRNQQPTLDTIEDHIEKTEINAKQAVREIEKAKDIQTAKRFNKLLLTGAIDTGLIAVGAIAGIPGMITGAILGGVITTIIFRSS